MSPIISVLIVVVPCVAAILGVLFWKLKPDTQVEAKLQDSLSKLDAANVELGAARLEAATAAANASASSQRAAEAVKLYESCHFETMLSGIRSMRWLPQLHKRMPSAMLLLELRPKLSNVF